MSTTSPVHENTRWAWLAGYCVLLFVCGTFARAAASMTVDLRASRGDLVTVTKIGKLASGGRQAFTVRLAARESLELRVPFAAAPFNGTQLHVQVNGRRLAPYVAFGGDTRYDAVKGKPGMRPPLATIEGRWTISARWLRRGDNSLLLWTTGIRRDPTLERLGPRPEIRIDCVMLGLLDGTRLPVFANTIYYDFNIWPQGYALGDDPNRLNYDLALLGVLNGKGMPAIIPSLGSPESSLWATKRLCEDFYLGWGVGHQEFYTIWEFASKPQLWAQFLDVDKNSETGGGLHEQTVFSTVVPRGADAVLYDVEKYADTLEPAIRALAPYTDFYNFKCEQDGPRGAGFGVDGERWKDFGLHGDAWAGNHYLANKAAHDLVRKYNPAEGRVQEMSHWRYGVRPVLYDTALRRKQPMGDLVDILMLHFDLMEANDRDDRGLSSGGNAIDRQYPSSAKFQPAFGEWPVGNRYPEIALDFNRYRLSRSEKDMTLGDPKVHRWGNGQPFDFRAGFRGDEMMYNSENGVWNTGYSGPAPYQFLHGFFSYSLLPTGAGEPRDLKMTLHRSLTRAEEMPVRRYGEWVDGVGHTKRLRTVDPLYGDLFGWTGTEHCNYGDYISMVGIKEPHHRLPPHDAFGLVRRVCYAFMTTGPVVPLAVNAGHNDNLFVKGLLQTIDHRSYIGLYAANFGEAPARLDVTLPLTAPAGTVATVYDDRAWDWTASARPLPLPVGKEFRYQVDIPALGAWLVLIPATPALIAALYELPVSPDHLMPVPDAEFTSAMKYPLLQWKTNDTRVKSFDLEVSREATFRPQDRVFRIGIDARNGSGSIGLTTELPAHVIGSINPFLAPLRERWRYFWRVSAVNARGQRSPWTTPRAFVYRWPEYAALYPPRTGDAPPLAKVATAIGPENLAWQGEIWGTGGYMHSPSRAVDGQQFSYWLNAQDEGNSVCSLPAEWCVIWPEPLTLTGGTIRWHEELLPQESALQISDDGTTWREIAATAGKTETVSEFTLQQPAVARYFRVLITRARQQHGAVAIREVVLR